MYGRISPESPHCPREGFNICALHAAVHIWQPVHFSRKFSTLFEPGGDGILLRGSAGSSEYGEASSLAEFAPARASLFAAERAIAPNESRAAPKERLGIPAGSSAPSGRRARGIPPELVGAGFRPDFAAGENLKDMDFLGQFAAQSKHRTHREKSSDLPLASMHWALQFLSHSPQDTHEDLSTSSLNSDILENSPSSAPTGHMELQ